MNNISHNIPSIILSEFNKGNKKIAILKMKEYLIKNPDDKETRFDLAYMYVKSNLTNEAINEYKIILKKKKDLQAMFNLAICFSSLNKFSESEKLLKKIIRIDKSHFKAYRALGDIYFNLNKVEKASKFLNLARKLIPHDPVLLNLLGALEMKKGNYKNSEKYFLASIKNKKDYRSAFNNLAALYQKTGKINKSLIIFNELLLKFPRDPNLLNNIGNVLIDLNRYKDAIKYLKKAIKINSSQSAFFSNLGRALFFCKKFASRTQLRQ